MKNDELHRVVDVVYMNKIPLKKRYIAKTLLREYLLDQLVKLQKSRLIPTEFNSSKLSHKQWQEILNYVILTKLSFFRIHQDLNKKQLTKIIEIVAKCLNIDYKNLEIKDIFAELDQDAIILKKLLTDASRQLAIC
jgi:hypothetical protein